MAARPKNGMDGAARVRTHRTNVAQLAARQDMVEDLLLGVLERLDRLDVRANPTAAILLGTAKERRDPDARANN
jgi:hypothetical protein